MRRTIFHIDQNCFFASVEMIAHPEYRNVPMAVTGDATKRHG
ncbi:MAG: DNA polymerase IV, partial [Clostridiales bacterium]|nr:DNA polymerase IV [Clostridiales bacterium]